MRDVAMRPRAIAKAVSHALAHPTRECAGALLVDARAMDDDARAVVDAQPLFHGDRAATAYEEIALEQTARCAATRGRVVVGTYRARARRGDDEEATTSATSEARLDAIERALKRARGENGGNGRRANAFEVTLDAAGLVRLGTARETREGGDATTFGVVERDDDGAWRRSSTTRAVVRDEDLGVVRELVRRTLDDADPDALAARDFDDHFDDARVDWTNAAFDRAVDAALNRAINS
jgi:hypothetical protein